MRTHSPPFDAPFGIFKRFWLARQRWFYEKNATINHVIAPECGAYKKTTKRRPSVHVLLNSTCTDGHQFSDWSTSAAGDQSENRNDGGGGISSWQKKGLSLLDLCLASVCFWVFAFPARKKKIGKRGAPEKKKWRERWTGPPTRLFAPSLVVSTYVRYC